MSRRQPRFEPPRAEPEAEACADAGAGERVTCALLRGAGEVLGEDFRSRYDKCVLFANDTLFASGADTVEYLPSDTARRKRHRRHR